MSKVALLIMVVMVAAVAGGLAFYFWTLQRKGRKALQQLFQQCQTLLTTSTDGIMILEKDDSFAFINETMRSLLGIVHSTRMLFRQDMPTFLVQDKRYSLDEAFKNLKNKNEPITFVPQVYAKTRRYDKLAADLYLGYLYDDQGYEAYRVVIVRDLREVFHEIASGKRDPLTQLPNRELAYQDFLQLCTQQHLHDSSLSLMLINIDNFLVAQSLLGHVKTDKTILSVAETLNAMKSHHIFSVYHLSYASFLLIFPHIESINQLLALAEAIQERLSALYAEHKSAVYLTASIGIASASTSGPAVDLYDHVHAALTEAMKLGPGSTFLYRKETQQPTQNVALLQNDIQYAIERQQLMIVYQPIVDAKTHEIVAAEALMRWNHPSHGMISPDVFIPLMEKTGFIIEAGHYLITEVVTQLEKWKQLGYKDITVSLNVSMREIDAPDYVEFLSRQLRSHFVEAHRVNVEITESMAMSNAEKMLSALERLHASGVPISLDDFGTGYTSFSYLTQMPASSLKIDKSFIDNFQEESRNQQVVRAIIEMGHALGMSIVAEGIESQEVATMLHDFGVDKLQGYFFYKPLPVFELQSLISNGTTPPEEGELPLHTLR